MLAGKNPTRAGTPKGRLRQVDTGLVGGGAAARALPPNSRRRLPYSAPFSRNRQFQATLQRTGICYQGPDLLFRPHHLRYDY
jgi:hypothetical protein